MDKRCLLLLGGGIMQLPALRLAQEMGLAVLVADGNRQAVAAEKADYFWNVDIADRFRLLESAREWRRSGGRIDAVFTAGTDFSTSVAYLAEQLRLPGIPYQTALRAKDKQKMRECFARHGVAGPPFVVVNTGQADSSMLGCLRFPLVVKPVDSMGARGVRSVTTLEELNRWLPTALADSRSRRVIIEEFIAGDEFSLDAIVENGRVTICGIADRHIFFSPFFVEMGHTIPSAADSGIIEDVSALFIRAVAALGIDNGAAKGDINHNGRLAVVGEVAARLSGGYMSGWSYPYSSGLQVTAAAIKIALGEPVGKLTAAHSLVAAERAFISIPGEVAAVEGGAAVKKSAAVRELFVSVGPGDRVRFPRNNVEKCGSIIAVAADRQQAMSAAEQAAAAMTVRLKAADRQTFAYLLQPSPPAYPFHRLEDSANRAELAAMPLYYGRPADIAALTANIPVAVPANLNREKKGNLYGQTIIDDYTKICEQYKLIETLPAQNGRPALGRLFWQLFCRGGTAAVCWLFETIQAMGDDFFKEALAYESHN